MINHFISLFEMWVIICSTMLCLNTPRSCFCKKNVKQIRILWHLMMQYTWNCTKGETDFLIKRKTAWSMHCKMAMLLVFMASLNMGALDAYHGGTCKSFWLMKCWITAFKNDQNNQKRLSLIFSFSSFNFGEISCSSIRQSSG